MKAWVKGKNSYKTMKHSNGKYQLIKSFETQSFKPKNQKSNKNCLDCL